MTSTDDGVDRARWDTLHAAGDTPTLRAIRAETLWRDLPRAVEPTTIWPSWPLERIAFELAVERDERLLDMACGRGDIGGWLAGHTGAALVGVDPSPVGLEAARGRNPDATFLEGHFEAIPLDDGSVDAALVVDAMQFAPDRVTALAELARVLRSGRRLVLLGPDGRPDQIVADAEAAGLTVELREETPAWRARMQAFIDGLAGREAALRAELGDAAAFLLARPAEALRGTPWHGLVVARRAER